MNMFCIILLLKQFAYDFWKKKFENVYIKFQTENWILKNPINPKIWNGFCVPILFLITIDSFSKEKKTFKS